MINTFSPLGPWKQLYGQGDSCGSWEKAISYNSKYWVRFSIISPVAFGYRALAAKAITEPQKFETNQLEKTNPLISLAKF